jgi:hypothetical protein
MSAATCVKVLQARRGGLTRPPPPPKIGSRASPCVPLEYLVTWSELWLRGLLIFVDQSRDDRFSADVPQVGHVPDGLRLDVRGRCRRDWCGLWPL